MSDISLDDVGNAESVLQRMIHERKTLDNVADVLRTYKAVKMQLNSEQQKLVQTRAALTQEKEALAKVDSDKQVMLAQRQQQIAEYVSSESAKATEAVTVLQGQIVKEQEKLAAVKQQIEIFQSEGDLLREEYQLYQKNAEAALHAVRVEYDALKEQISKVAAQLQR